MDILEYSGPFRVLSNMAAAKVQWGDKLTPERIWPNSEVPYFLARTNNPDFREKIIQTARAGFTSAQNNGKPYEDAVEIGGKMVKKLWNTEMKPGDADEARKLLIMKAVVFDKIGRNTSVQQIFDHRNGGLIQEGNRHGDTFWGVALCDIPRRGVLKGQGQNHLGKLHAEGESLYLKHGPEHLLEVAKTLRQAMFEPPIKVQSTLFSTKTPAKGLGHDEFF